MEFRLAYPDDQPVLAFAAREIARCLAGTGFDCAAVPGTQFAPDRLTLCCGPHADARMPDMPDAALDDAFVVDVTDGTGIIAGSNPRSTLIAAYRYLSALGFAWIRPGRDGEIVPEHPPVRHRVLLIEKAASRHRGVCIEGAASYRHVADMIDWLPKLGLNGYFLQFFTPYTFYERWYNHEGNPQLTPQPVSVDDVQAMVRAHRAEMQQRGLMLHTVGHGWTCEPFGVQGLGWNPVSLDGNDAYQSALALVNGRRALTGGVTLDTQLCYSQDAVRARMVRSMADYCAENPDVDYLHVWLADGTNNHCECENCAARRPADWYVQLLNELDEALEARGLDTRVVFLVYVDLLWEPIEARLRHPERFVLMFAPIMRTYTKSFDEANDEPEPTLAPYVRNKLDFSPSVRENLTRLSRWQAQFGGDSFDFDYHLWYDQARDVSYCATAQVLFRDAQALGGIGLNGLVSCQVQRCCFPTALPMHAMAAGLWNAEASYADVTAAYYQTAFGEGWREAQAYLERLCELMPPPYLRGELSAVSPEAAAFFAQVPAHAAAFLPLAERRAADEANAPMRRSWALLSQHAVFCVPLSRALCLRASGKAGEALAAWQALREDICAAEEHLHDAFDGHIYFLMMDRLFQAKMQPHEEATS